MFSSRSLLLSALTVVSSGVFLTGTASAACPATLVIDDGDCGHTLIGTWFGTPGAGDGYRGDQFYAETAQSASQLARSEWNFTDLTGGMYDVYVTWSASDSGMRNISTKTPVVVRTGKVQQTIFVNQSIDPQDQGGVLHDGTYWFKLGEFSVTDGALKVLLSNRANGKVVLADAVRLKKHSAGGSGSGFLRITGKATASTDVVVENQKNVPLLRFEARADQATDDVLFTEIGFEAATNGALHNANNYTLWVDTNSDGVVDTILEAGVVSQNGGVIFDALMAGGFVLPKTGQVSVFEVHADIAPSITHDDTLSIRFNTGTVFAMAEWVSTGTPLKGIGTRNPAGQYEPDEGTYVDSGAAGQIQVQTQYATRYTLKDQGDLYVTKSSTPTRERQLLGGTLASEILHLQFHSEYEDIDVTKLVFTATDGNASSFLANVDRLELYLVGSVTPFAVATVGGCGVDPVPANSMCANTLFNEFIVPKGSNTNILIRPRMRTDTNGAISGHDVVIRMGPESLYVEARGLASSNDLDANDGDALPEGEVFIGTSSAAPNAIIKSKFNEVVLSKITSITNADPNANGTAVPTGSNRAIGQFKFSAAANNNTKNGVNKWTMDNILFNVNATNIDMDGGSFELYNKADPLTKAPCSLVGASGSSSLLVQCTSLAGSGVDTEIDPGTDITFVLEADITNAKVNAAATSTLLVSFQNFADYSKTVFGPTDSHILWLDKDNVGSTSFLWIEYPETSVHGTTYNA